jgi:PIN domain nuclease of toxin-antitoxin system
MRSLLDTHAFLWFIEGDTRLTAAVRPLIEDPASAVFISSASLWETAIKISTGKLLLSQPFETLIPQQIALNDIALLDIEISHLSRVTGLPFHHRDPFDRLLIAQAMAEGLPIVSADHVFDAYGVTRLW